jgi:hypothetical protein
MILNAKSPRFITSKADLLHTEGKLSVSVPLINRGTGAANNIRVTDISLDAATRLEPAAMPVFLGTLEKSNVILVNARFDASSLVLGSDYQVSIHGTYESGDATYRFAVNRSIVVPTPQAPLIDLLNAHVEVSAKPNKISYVLFNDESNDSPQHINTFSLDVVAPVVVTGTPKGWDVETDNKSYVLWYSAGPQLPDPNNVAPGKSLGGFEIQTAKKSSESTGFSMTACNHQTHDSGRAVLGSVLSPAR